MIELRKAGGAETVGRFRKVEKVVRACRGRHVGVVVARALNIDCRYGVDCHLCLRRFKRTQLKR